MPTPFDSRFFSSTRGRVVLLLRQESRTVEELAASLGLTDNAVRAHLTTLERDGLVQHSGLRYGAGKPSYEYLLTPEADALFPKPYAQVLNVLLDLLPQQIGSEQGEQIMREAGRRLAAELTLRQTELRDRLHSAVAVLNEMGGLAEVREENGSLAIQGYNCPLSAVVPGHPHVCKLVETLVSDMVGIPMEEHCTRTTPWLCRLEVAASAK